MVNIVSKTIEFPDKKLDLCDPDSLVHIFNKKEYVWNLVKI